MTTVAKNTNAKKENLPTPPKGGKKKSGKAWILKRQDNAMRALKAVTRLHERFGGGVRTEHRPDFAAKTGSAATAIKTILGSLEGVVKTIAELSAAGFKPENEKVKLDLEPGVQVWLKGKVWRRRYHGLFNPTEMANLKITIVAGKQARARSEAGIEVVEPIGSFTVKEVDYVAAAAESEEAAA